MIKGEVAMNEKPGGKIISAALKSLKIGKKREKRKMITAIC